MEIREKYMKAGNSQPGEKDAAAAVAGVDFCILVGKFDTDYGTRLREWSN
jgi:hypothetical protein